MTGDPSVAALLPPVIKIGEAELARRVRQQVVCVDPASSRLIGSDIRRSRLESSFAISRQIIGHNGT